MKNSLARYVYFYEFSMNFNFPLDKQGHDRMVSQYVKICKSFNCKAKVFTQMTADFGKQIGAPDLLVLFTSTVSHKMIRTAVDGAKGSRTEVVRCHTSSKTALEEILQEHCAAC